MQRDFLLYEDRYLIHATLEGQSYAVIAHNLSQGSQHFSGEDCRKRVRGFTAQSVMLPQSWEDPNIEIPPASELVTAGGVRRLQRGIYADTLLPYERAEVLLYVYHRKRLYIPYIFRSYISAVLLRECINDLEDLRKDQPEFFQIEVDEALATGIARRQDAERQWHERLARPQGWTYQTNAAGWGMDLS